MAPATPDAALEFAPDRSAAYLAHYAHMAASAGVDAARAALLGTLAGQPAADWLACGRALVLRSDLVAALAVFTSAVENHPESIDLRQGLASLLWQTGQPAAAESVLRAVLEERPDDAAAVFLLARIFRQQGRMRAVETIVRPLFERASPDTQMVIQAIELLDDCGRKRAAAEVVEKEIAAGATDPRLHAYAGMLDMQLGDFERARERYSFALEKDPRALDWQSAYGLAASTQYATKDHPDFDRLRTYLQRPGLGDKARASVLFALAKANDDIAAYAQAADCLREANRRVNDGVEWSRKNWRRSVAARLDAKAMPPQVEPVADFTPLFIVGLPRSGTTLVAERLARHRDVCNRGESGWLPFLARELAGSGKNTQGDRINAAATYRTQIRQDDSTAQWFIDKQPLNFMHVDLIASLFPNARIIWCRRSGRDTALSIWMHYFAGPENNFAYDFADIAAVAQGCDRLMASSRARHASMIREIHYEALTRNPGPCMGQLAAWIGLPELDDATTTEERSVISTASAWQARQPVYRSSVGRWQSYAAYLPELLQFPDAKD